jgi:hypothetical protein
MLETQIAERFLEYPSANGPMLLPHLDKPERKEKAAGYEHTTRDKTLME